MEVTSEAAEAFLLTAYDLKADCGHCGHRHPVLHHLTYDKDFPAGEEVPVEEFFAGKELPRRIAGLFRGGPLLGQCPATRMVFSVEGPGKLYLFSTGEIIGK